MAGKIKIECLSTESSSNKHLFAFDDFLGSLYRSQGIRSADSDFKNYRKTSNKRRVSNERRSPIDADL